MLVFQPQGQWARCARELSDRAKAAPTRSPVGRAYGEPRVERYTRLAIGSPYHQPAAGLPSAFLDTLLPEVVLRWLKEKKDAFNGEPPWTHIDHLKE